MSVLDLPEIPVKNVFRDYASWKLRNTLLRITCQVEWIISIVNDFIMVTEWFWYSRWPLDLPEFPVKMCFGDIGIWKFSWPKYSWWSPDSWFSDNVDIFCKKSQRKILPEEKVMASNFFGKNWFFFTNNVSFRSWARGGIHIWTPFSKILQMIYMRSRYIWTHYLRIFENFRFCYT